MVAVRLFGIPERVDFFPPSSTTSGCSAMQTERAALFSPHAHPPATSSAHAPAPGALGSRKRGSMGGLSPGRNASTCAPSMGGPDRRQRLLETGTGEDGVDAGEVGEDAPATVADADGPASVSSASLLVPGGGDEVGADASLSVVKAPSSVSPASTLVPLTTRGVCGPEWCGQEGVSVPTRAADAIPPLASDPDAAGSHPHEQSDPVRCSEEATGALPPPEPSFLPRCPVPHRPPLHPSPPFQLLSFRHLVIEGYDEAHGIVRAAAYDTASVTRPVAPPPPLPTRCRPPKFSAPRYPSRPAPAPGSSLSSLPGQPLTQVRRATGWPDEKDGDGDAAPPVERPRLLAFSGLHEAVAGSAAWARTHPEVVAALRERVKGLVTPAPKEMP